MAGGNFFGRVIGYLVNEVVVEGLANNHAFQRFAVRTSKTLENFSTKLRDAKSGLTEQLKNASEDVDQFKKQ